MHIMCSTLLTPFYRAENYNTESIEDIMLHDYDTNDFDKLLSKCQNVTKRDKEITTSCKNNKFVSTTKDKTIVRVYFRIISYPLII